MSSTCFFYLLGIIKHDITCYGGSEHFKCVMFVYSALVSACWEIGQGHQKSNYSLFQCAMSLWGQCIRNARSCNLKKPKTNIQNLPENLSYKVLQLKIKALKRKSSKILNCNNLVAWTHSFNYNLISIH